MSELLLTTSSPKAAAHYHEGVRLLLRGDPGAEAAFRAAVRCDLDLTVAHAGIAVALAPGPASLLAIEQARRRGVRPSRWERQHVDVVASAVTGALERAVALGREHLAEFPGDVLAVWLVASLAAGKP